jgi:hypothetical protein
MCHQRHNDDLQYPESRAEFLRILHVGVAKYELCHQSVGGPYPHENM